MTRQVVTGLRPVVAEGRVVGLEFRPLRPGLPSEIVYFAGEPQHRFDEREMHPGQVTDRLRDGQVTTLVVGIEKSRLREALHPKRLVDVLFKRATV